MKDLAAVLSVQGLAWCTTAATSAKLPHTLPMFVLAWLAGAVVGHTVRWAFAGPDDPQSLRAAIGGVLLSAGITAVVFGFGWVDETVLRVFAVGWGVSACAEYWPRFKRRGADKADKKLEAL